MNKTALKLMYAQTIVMGVFFTVVVHLMVMMCNYGLGWNLGHIKLVGITVAFLAASYGITCLFMRNDPLAKFERDMRRKLDDTNGLLMRMRSL